MADKHPYVQSAGHLVQIVNHLRKAFPAKVTADTLKRLGFAPKNESYVINTLRFLRILDDDGGRTEAAAMVFSYHEDNKFQAELGKLVRAAYDSLFGEHGESAWNLGADQLITFFRHSDQSSEIVGTRQGNTFLTLSGLTGHSALPAVKARASKEKVRQKTEAVGKKAERGRRGEPAGRQGAPETLTGKQADRPFGLTVRIEVNLPASGDQAMYDRIFKSIRENLLNG